MANCNQNPVFAKMRSLIVIACLLATTLAVQKSYEGHKVFYVSPTTKDQAGALNSWVEVDGINFWDSPRNAGQSGRVMVAPSVLSQFEDFLATSGVNYQLIIENVEDTLVKERADIAKKDAQLLARKAEGRGTLDFGHFWRYEEIYAYIDTVAAQNPSIMTVETGGYSSEGREIKVVKISTTEVQGDKPMIFIDVGIHAREWATYVTGVYLIHELVEHYEENRDIVDNVDWVIVPVANPDGYEFSQTNDRFWRKTRSVNEGSTCLGIDPNRNFGFVWGGASDEPCSEVFQGTEPHSAPEVRLITEILEEYRGQTSLYLAVHSFGSYLLFPWGFDFVWHDNNDDFQALGDLVADAIESYRGEVYAVGNSAFLLYPATGASDDFAVGARDVPLGYTIELPGGGIIGFDLPVSEIEPVVNEMFLGFQAYARYLIGQKAKK